MAKDLELVKRALAGERNGFREIVTEYQRLVNHIVSRMIPHFEDREDLCQEVFIKVYRNLGNFRGESKLSTWIGRIAANRCIDWLQASRLPSAGIPAEEAVTVEDKAATSPDVRAEEKSLGEVLKKEIERLDHPYRTILTLFHLDELSYNEIGDVLRMPEGTVKSYLFRARRKLRERLTARYNIEELMS